MSSVILKKVIAIIVFILIIVMGYIPATGKTIEKMNDNPEIENNRTTFDVPIMETGATHIGYPPDDIWNKTFGGSDYDRGWFVQQTNDGGYIITASTYSFGAGNYDVWLIKTDENGNMGWNKTFGWRYEDSSHCVRQTTDGGFVIVGYYGNGHDGPYDVWIIKTDINGNLEWDKTFRSPTSRALGDCVIELDDGYLILANIYSGSPDFSTDIWLIKTDLNGNKIWDKMIGGFSGDDSGNSVIRTNEDNFLIVGGTYGFFGLDLVLLIKTDSNGNRLWRKTYWGKDGYGVFETDDNCYMISAGRAGYAYIIKTNNNGKELWTKEYDRSGSYWCDSSAQTSDKGYVVAGSTSKNFFDIFLFKIDENGDKLWETTIGGVERDVANCVIESNDGNYVIVGETGSFGSGAWDVWLIKMPTFENQRPNKPSKPIGPTHVRPGPWYNYSTNSSDPDGELLYYYWDWDDGSGSSWYGPYNNNETCEVQTYFLSSGKFNIRVRAKDIYGGVSDFSEPLTVTASRDKATYNVLLLRLLERFPLLQKLLLLIK